MGTDSKYGTTLLLYPYVLEQAATRTKKPITNYSFIMLKRLFPFFALLLLLTGCGGNSGSSDYVSVMVDGSNMWSLLDVKSGKLSFTDEFFAPATNVVKGAFFVQTDEGSFDLYSISDTKNKLNRESYTYITNFNPQGNAIVRVKNEPWQIVDTKGTVIATIDKNYAIFGGFSTEGIAPFFNKDHQVGYLDKTGNVIIKPRYIYGTCFTDGIAMVKVRTEGGKDYWEAIDTKGETQFKFNNSQYSNFSMFNNGYAFFTEGDHIVLLDKKGKKVTTVCNGDNINLSLLGVYGDKFTYSDKEFFGVKDLNGNILIRAKYPYLSFNGDGNLLAANSSGRYGVVTPTDEIVVPFEYSKLSYLAPKRYLTDSGSVIILINNEGKEVGDHAFTSVVNRTQSSDENALMQILTSKNNTSSYSSSNSMINNTLESIVSQFGFDDDDFVTSPDVAYSGSSSSDGGLNLILQLDGKLNKIPFKMTLRINNGLVTGSYYYTKTGSGSEIHLSGSLIRESQVRLIEDVNGETTGEWEIIFEQDGASVIG
ncbi:MAG: WG repeat-containing protein, partial [Muribaculaceae bacterium]|nr:WG repeat-containing protein [Muribaculaceae bacterium]